MKVILVVELNEDEAKAVSFAGKNAGRGSNISKELALRSDPRKTPIDKDTIQQVLTSMVNANVNQCLHIFGIAINQHSREAALVNSIMKPKQ